MALMMKLLLVERIGVAGVAVLIAGSLQEGDGREVAGGDGVVEIVDVVLVVGRHRCWTDRGNRGGPRVGRVGGGCVVLEGLVVGDVVGLGDDW